MVASPVSSMKSPLHHMQNLAMSGEKAHMCKVLLSPIGTIWTLGRLVQFQFMLNFFEFFI